eukprot:2022276-Pyramimonas_sp.AAC.1
MCSAIDTNKVISATSEIASPFKSVLEHTWMFGYKIPTYNVGQTANGLGMVKALAYGSVEILCFDCHQLLPALRALLKKDVLTFAEVTKYIEQIGSSDIAELANINAKVVHASLKAQSVIYIPS